MFKVGDQVRVKPLKPGEEYLHDGHPIARDYQGEVGVVFRVDDRPNKFNVAVKFMLRGMRASTRYKEEELEFWNGLERAIGRVADKINICPKKISSKRSKS